MAKLICLLVGGILGLCMALLGTGIWIGVLVCLIVLIVREVMADEEVFEDMGLSPAAFLLSYLLCGLFWKLLIWLR